MFENLKNQLKEQEIFNESVMILKEMAEGGAPEDDVLDSIVIPEEETPELNKLIDRIPDTPIGNTEELTDADLNKAADDVPDPTIDELLNDDMF